MNIENVSCTNIRSDMHKWDDEKCPFCEVLKLKAKNERLKERRKADKKLLRKSKKLLRKAIDEIGSYDPDYDTVREINDFTVEIDQAIGGSDGK